MNKEHHIVSVPMVGHGNPAAAYALEEIIQQDGRRVDLVNLDKAAIPAAFFHQVMSQFSVFKAYHRSSEKSRVGLPAKAIQIAMYLEFISALHVRKIVEQPSTNLYWHVIQEFPLLGNALVATFALSMQQTLPDFDERTIVVPDTYPKASAIQTAKYWQAPLQVWNTATYEALHELSVPATLVSPHILHSFETMLVESGIPSFNKRGTEVVIKSSGSGMPRQLATAIETACQKAGVEYTCYLPDKTITYKENRIVDKRNARQIKDRLIECYSGLGIHTKWVICYPSEMVQIITEMHMMGSEVGFIALPPRGEHEINNLEWALKNHLCSGVLTIDSNTDYNSPWPQIPLAYLAEILRDQDWQRMDLCEAVGQLSPISSI